LAFVHRDAVVFIRNGLQRDEGCNILENS